MMEYCDDLIVQKYTKENKSVGRIAAEVNLTPYTINKILKKSNVKKRSLSTSHIVRNFDRTFFNKIDSEEKAYFLGFIYADGNIFGPALQICVAARDVDVLIKLKESLKSDHKIRDDCGNKRIGINGDFLVADLKRLGCGPRKSFTLQFPDSSQVPDNLIRHFMRGFFDGDGSIRYIFQEKPKHVLWKFSIIGPESFLIRYRDILADYCQIKKANLYREKRVSQPFFYIDIGSTNRENLIKIFDFLYKDATVFLQRKYDKFLEIDSLILKKIEWRKLNPIGIPEGKLEEFKKIMTENCDKPIQYVCNLLGRKDAQSLKNLYVRLGIPRN